MGDYIGAYFFISIFATYGSLLVVTSGIGNDLSDFQMVGVLVLTFLFWPITLALMLYKLIRAGITGVRILTRDKRFDNL